MENYNNDFEFGSNTNEELEQENNFKFDSISGLGESDYENEDLFNVEVNNDTASFVNNDFMVGSSDSVNTDYEADDTLESDISLDQDYLTPLEPEYNLNDNSNDVEEVTEEEKTEEDDSSEGEQDKISFSDTPIEELNKLTEYEENKIETTDINSLFEKVSMNVQDASEIFRKNNDLKQKIDSSFDKLKKLQSEIENARKTQVDEINSYKEEVYSKLTEKKEEIEKRLNLLKESQASFEKEKQEFEQYKKEEKEKIEEIQKEVQSAYDSRREELSHIEDVLRKQKDALDEERNQLGLDRIEYESDKNALANNLLKFNELVNSFTNGVKDTKE